MIAAHFYIKFLINYFGLTQKIFIYIFNRRFFRKEKNAFYSRNFNVKILIITRFYYQVNFFSHCLSRNLK